MLSFTTTNKKRILPEVTEVSDVRLEMWAYLYAADRHNPDSPIAVWEFLYAEDEELDECVNLWYQRNLLQKKYILSVDLRFTDREYKAISMFTSRTLSKGLASLDRFIGISHKKPKIRRGRRIDRH